MMRDGHYIIGYAEDRYTVGVVFEAHCACGWVSRPVTDKGIAIIEAERHLA